MSWIKYKRIPGLKKNDNPIWKSWNGMMNRCYSKNNHDFKYYGARGIIVCSGWHEFENFLNDMGPSYKNGLSIDRIDVNGNYDKDNCRWATHKQQCNNRRSNNCLANPKTGESKTITEWAKIFGLSRNTITSRLRLGYRDFNILMASQHTMRNGKLKEGWTPQ